VKLYSFFRSGTYHRLRIALNLKGLKPDYVGIDLRTEEHLKASFKAINPQGFVPAYEALLNKNKNRFNFSYGDTPTLADIYLIPQIESARRFKVDISQWPLIASIETACMQLDAFKDAAAMQQIDAS